MMFRNFSTFSSRRYLIAVAASALLGTILLSGVSLAGLRYGLLDFAFNDLYRYQLAKLDSRKQIDVVFVGDSSLGNSIDAQYLSGRTGLPAINLALTGAYGYGGTLNMLRRAVAVFHPKVVVIVQTADMLTRGNAHEGFIHTVLDANELLTVPPRDVLAVVANLDNIVSMLRRLVRSTGVLSNTFDNDYIRQSSPLDSHRSFGALDPASINPIQLEYIKRIAQYCRDAGTRCIYAHGPLVDRPCKHSEGYFREANAFLGKAGLSVVAGTPVCIPAEAIGDAPDHVAPTHKHQFTDLYLDLLSKDVPLLGWRANAPVQ